MLHGGLRVEESVYGVPPAACRGLGEKSALAREKKAETSFIRRVRLLTITRCASCVIGAAHRGITARARCAAGLDGS